MIFSVHDSFYVCVNLYIFLLFMYFKTFSFFYIPRERNFFVSLILPALYFFLFFFFSFFLIFFILYLYGVPFLASSAATMAYLMFSMFFKSNFAWLSGGCC